MSTSPSDVVQFVTHGEGKEDERVREARRERGFATLTLQRPVAEIQGLLLMFTTAWYAHTNTCTHVHT
jgi:hypothetical protein